ncbi:MAG: GNAT family N-acetyltransferase [Anaerolineales bacterium]
MSLKLETERLLLRPLRMKDAVLFSEYRSDPQVARYQGWTTPFSLVQARQFIREMKTVLPGTPGQWFQLAIELKKERQMIGDCAFVILEKDAMQAEIGFTLAQPYQGQGYASEAVRRLLTYLLVENNLHRVRANCDEENLASANLLERVGMRREAHFIKSLWFKGRWSSEYWYAILRHEWIGLEAEG